MEPTKTQSKELAPIDKIRQLLDNMTGEFKMVLPSHIPVDRFKRVVVTAVNGDPDLLVADRKSLFASCMRAAQDGLLPDKREGALVIFNTKSKDGGWIKAVQWMPMVYGIIKKMRNSGELASIVAHPVYQNDKFHYALGDEEKIEHEPVLLGEPGKMIAVYAIAKLKDGTVQREVMTRAEVDKVRAVSKAKDGGPWSNWYEEMARKTVVRRLSKYLPMSPEIERMMSDEDEAQAAERALDVTPAGRPERQTPSAPQDEAAEPFYLVNSDGTELVINGGPAAFATAFMQEMEKSGAESIVEGLWESNSGQLGRVRSEAEGGEKIAQEVHAAYAAALAMFRQAKPASEPKVEEMSEDQTEAATDWETFVHDAKKEVGAMTSLDKIEAWEAENAEMRRKLVAAKPKLAGNLAGAIDAVKRGLKNAA